MEMEFELSLKMIVSSDVRPARWPPPLPVKAFRFLFFVFSSSRKPSEISEQGIICAGVFLKIYLAGMFRLR